MRGLLLIIIAVTVTACGLSPPPSGSRSYSTQRGGEALPWELKVWNSNKTTLRATYTNTTPVGIGAGGFEWEIEGNGNCVQMQFQGVPTLLNIQPRDIVQLSVDGTNAFYGIVDQPPPFKNALVGYTAVGAKKLLERVIPLARRFGAMTDAGQVITATVGGVFNRDGLRAELPPQITYTAGRVSGTLPALGVWRSGHSGESLAQTLDALSGAATTGGVTVAWGVDAGGVFFFGVPVGTYSVGYASSGWDRLPIQAADIVSRVGVVISGQNPTVLYTRSSVPPLTVYLGEAQNDPIIRRTAVTADHLLYSQEIAVSTGATDWLETSMDGPTGVFATTSLDVLNASDASDGNPSTYAESISVANPAQIFMRRIEATASNFPNVVGFEIEYSTTSATISVNDPAIVIEAKLGGFFAFQASLLLPKTQNHSARNRARILFQLPVTADDYLLFFYAATYPSDGVRVYTMMPLRTMSRLDEYAKSFIKLPAVVAASLELPGIIAPLPIASVTGVPILGTVTSAAPSWKYSLKRGEGRKTSVQLGNRVVSEDSSVIARTVSDADRRDLANARAYTDR